MKVNRYQFHLGIILLIIFIDSNLLFSLQDGFGFPLITRYSTRDYDASEDNWSVIQDKRGIMYFANRSGVLEYDGTGWNLIKLDDNRVATALAIDSKGKVYVGGINTFGYLEPDVNGSTKYVSLSKKLSAQLPEFTYVRKIIIHNNQIFIGDDNYIFRIEENKVSVFYSEKMLDFLYEIDGRFLVNQQGNGLFEYSENSLKIIPKGNFFKNGRVWAILSVSKNKILISDGNGLYFYNGQYISKFKTEADNLFNQFPVFTALKLKNNNLAFGTLGGGLVILNENGELLQHLTKASGLSNDFITSIFADNQNGLWCTTMIGISRIDLSGAISIIDNRLGIDEYSVSIEKHKGKYYVAALNGLYQQVEDKESAKLTLPDSYLNFKKNSQVPVDCRGLLSVGEHLLVGSVGGTYILRKDKSIKISDSYSEIFYRSKIDSNLVYAGEFGLRLFYFKNGTWMDAGKIKGISSSVNFITEDKDGTVWIRTENHGIIRIKGIVEKKKPDIKKYGTEHGLPSLETGSTTIVDGKIINSFEDGIYTYNYKNDRFNKDTLFHNNFTPPLPYKGMEIYQQINGNLCILLSEDGNKILKYYIRNRTGKYIQQSTAASLINTIGVHILRQRSSDYIWFANEKGLYISNFLNNQIAGNTFTVSLRNIFLGNDSLLYSRSTGFKPHLSYNNNNLRFEAAGLNYAAPAETKYQFRLQGMEDSWSKWSRDPKKEYTNIPPGEYSLHIRAKNVYDIVSDEVTFPFIILPPFWGTWWFRAFIVLAAVVGIVYSSRYFFNRRFIALQREQKQHEEFSRKLIASQEQERQRIASDLHDSIGQNILVIKNHAQIAAQQGHANSEKDLHILNIAKIATESLEEVRAISHNLRPIHLEEFGLKDSLQSLITNVQKISKTYITLIMEFEEEHIPREYDINIYRVVQESLNNIVKYSEAENALVQLTENNNILELLINDDGKGTEEINEGFGIAGMKERIKIMDGDFKISSKQKGTSIKALIPLN